MPLEKSKRFALTLVMSSARYVRLVSHPVARHGVPLGARFGALTVTCGSMRTRASAVSPRNAARHAVSSETSSSLFAASVSAARPRDDATTREASCSCATREASARKSARFQERTDARALAYARSSGPYITLVSGNTARRVLSLLRFVRGMLRNLFRLRFARL